MTSEVSSTPHDPDDDAGPESAQSGNESAAEEPQQLTPPPPKLMVPALLVAIIGCLVWLAATGAFSGNAAEAPEEKQEVEEPAGFEATE